MHMLYVTVHAQLCASRHVTCLRRPQWRFLGRRNEKLVERGKLHLPYTFTLQQMCHLFNLKGASNSSLNQ